MKRFRADIKITVNDAIASLTVPFHQRHLARQIMTKAGIPLTELEGFRIINGRWHLKSTNRPWQSTGELLKWPRPPIRFRVGTPVRITFYGDKSHSQLGKTGHVIKVKWVQEDQDLGYWAYYLGRAKTCPVHGPLYLEQELEAVK